MYTKISQGYDGEMGFDESTQAILGGRSPLRGGNKLISTESQFARVVRNITFWNWRDSKGRAMRIEYSIGNCPVETQKDQRVSVMAPAFVKFLEPAVAYYSSTYPENPQMFGELAAFNADGQSMGANYYFSMPSSEIRMDEQERADYILAATKGAKELGMIAINFWGSFVIDDHWTLGPGSPTVRSGQYDYPASPIYRVLTAIIKPEGN